MAYGLTVVNASTEGPIALAKTKAHLKVTWTTEDVLISSYMEGAWDYIERVLGRSLRAQTLKLTLDAWPEDEVICFPRPPLASVTSIKYRDVDSVLQTIDAANYLVDVTTEPGRVVPISTYAWPTLADSYPSAIEIEYVAGWALEANVPGVIKNAFRLLVGHYYENREDTIAGQQIMPIPKGVDALLMTAWTGTYYP